MIINLITSVLQRIRAGLAAAGSDNRGIGVVEVILILVVLIGLVVIFRDQLTTLINGIFGRITEDTSLI